MPHRLPTGPRPKRHVQAMENRKRIGGERRPPRLASRITRLEDPHFGSTIIRGIDPVPRILIRSKRPMSNAARAAKRIREKRRRERVRIARIAESNRLGRYSVHPMAEAAGEYHIRGLGTTSNTHGSENTTVKDEDAQSHVALKHHAPFYRGPPTPPYSARSIDQILQEARDNLKRLTPYQALREYNINSTLSRTAQMPSPDSPSRSAPVSLILVDIRPAAQREAEGQLSGSNVYIIERNVLEWRLDPQCEARLNVADYGLRVIVLCQEGYTSSLAARALHDLGLSTATDVIGGFKAWRDGGLPLVLN